ncbi:MAG TPA: hypothetical protein VMU22_10745 [Rhizomicrobium sp.]|nr:hypothetical protein [Rhizomicrobium sp.]
MMGLTRRQQACLDAVRAFQAEHGVMPTLEELKLLLGMKSRSNVSGMLNRLEQRGAIKRMHGRARAIDLLACPRCGKELRRPK